MPSNIDFINTGTGANSGNGDSLRTAFNKINQNFINLESSFVAAGVSSFNGQTGVVTFTSTDITSVLGFTPYPDSNPNGFVSSSTLSLVNYAQKSYVDQTFVTITNLANENYVRQAYVDNALTEYATLAFIENQGYIVPTALPNYLSGYITETELFNSDVQLRSYVTTTIKLSISQNNIVPDTDNNYDLGAEEYRFRTLFLSNAMYIQGIGISVDPGTSRLYVDGNDIIGGFKFTAQSIASGDGYGFTFGSQYNIETATPGNAYAYFPSQAETGQGRALKLINTGTSGVSIQGSTSGIEIDRNGVNRINITGKLGLPLSLQGEGFLGSLPQLGHHVLKITENSVVTIGGSPVPKHLTISVEGTSTFQPLLIKGSRLSFYAYNKFDQDRTGNELIDPAYMSLGTDGLALGKNFGNGIGDPSTPDQFEGWKLPLYSGQPGQLFRMGSSGTAEWVTISGGVDFSNIAGSILPATDLLYDLGSGSRQWRSLYVSSSTIYMSGVSLSVTSDGNIKVGNKTYKTNALSNNGFEASLDSTGNLVGFNFVGSSTKRVARTFIDFGGIDFIQGSIIKPTTSGKVHITGITSSTNEVVQHIVPVSAQTVTWLSPPAVIDSYTKKVLNNEILTPDPAWQQAYFAPSGLDANGKIQSIDVLFNGAGYAGAVAEEAENYMWAAENGTPLSPFDIDQWQQIPFSVLSGPDDVTLLAGGGGNALTNGSYNFTLGVDGTVNFDPSTNGNGVLQTTADLQITANTSTWIFGQAGVLELPSLGAIKQNNSWTRTTSPNLNTNSAVVWTSTENYISGAKLTIQVEAHEIGDATGWHSQVCEAVIASRGYASSFGGPGGEPVMTVYGVTHTSTVPLVTFTVQRNPTNKNIEVVGNLTTATTSADLRIYSVETSTRD